VVFPAKYYTLNLLCYLLLSAMKIILIECQVQYVHEQELEGFRIKNASRVVRRISQGKCANVQLHSKMVSKY
jgi:hypothetical protein